MGWGVPYLLPWALNDTGKALLGRGVQKKMPWAEEYLFYGLSWISPESHPISLSPCVDRGFVGHIDTHTHTHIRVPTEETFLRRRVRLDIRMV